MNSERSVIFVLDDDSSVREALSSLLRSAGLQVSEFASAKEFLEAKKPDSPGCLILDLQLPDINGLELQRELVQADGPPIVFISGHADIPTSVSAMKAGAVEFLPKPFSDQELLTAVESAIAKDRSARQSRSELDKLQKSYARL